MAVDFVTQVRALLPQLPLDAAQIIATAWDRTGSLDLALSEFRQHARYNEFFPGNLLPDRSVRLSEADFFRTVQGYRDALGAVNPVLPSLLLTPERIGRLIESGTSDREFEAQTQALWEGVLTQEPAQRIAFLRQLGEATPETEAITDEAVFAAAFDEGAPDGTTRTALNLGRAIQAAQVSTEAQRFGFGFLGREQALRFQGIGLTQERGREVFGQARELIPSLNRLREVFADPANPLTLDRFVNAMQLGDPDELGQIERLLRRSQTQFSPQGLLGREDEGIAALR